jgi:hypothetical protein
MTSRRGAGWAAVAAGACVAMTAWGAWGGGAGAASASALAAARIPAASVTETFGYAGEVTQTAVVPVGATLAQVAVIAGKGGGTKGLRTHVTGGDGAQVSGQIAVSAGEVLRLQVAGHGGNANYNHGPGGGGWGATGHGGHGGAAFYGDGGGGGGASGLEIDGNTVVTAGGGGGAGGRGLYETYAGGPGGSSGATVDPGHNGGGLSAGKGGGGGGGADGGFGGGGAGIGAGGGGGGGAGSSHHTSRLEAPQVVRGTTSDGNGLIVITWNDVSAPVCADQAVDVPLDSPGVPVGLPCSRITGSRIDAGPRHGHLVNVDPAAGTFSYVPDLGYTGDDELTFQGLFGDLASAVHTLTFVVRDPAPMDLTASSDHVVLGHPPVLTVTMPAGATGIVGFYDEDLPGTGKAIGTVPITGRLATLVTPTRELGVGTHSVYASYGGNARYGPADSNVVVIIVSPRR